MPGYDEEARYFEAAVRADKRTELVAKAYAAVAGVRDAQLAALKARTLQRFQADLQAAVEAGEEGFSAAAAGWVPRHSSQQQQTDSHNCVFAAFGHQCSKFHHSCKLATLSQLCMLTKHFGASRCL
jgi:Root hair defective 3 GTP-binding protein (RHD3)